MNIVKIEKRKGNNYRIYFLDNTYLDTFGDVLLNNKLLAKGNIDIELLNKVKIESEYYRQYFKIEKSIRYKLRSKKEIEYRLRDNSYKNKIINELEKKNLINDEIFLKAYVADKYNLSKYGEYIILSKLVQHGIEKDLIKAELQKYDFYSKGLKLANKRLNKSSENSYPKLYKYLFNLGYKSARDITRDAFRQQKKKD